MTEQAALMVSIAEQFTSDRKDAISLIRAILRYFGGQQLYLPRSPESSTGSRTVQELRGVSADEIGDAAAMAFVRKFLQVFGGGHLYVHLEREDFKDEIAEEIYSRYDGTKETMAELCREYQTTYVQIYRYFKRAQARRLQAIREPELFEIP